MTGQMWLDDGESGPPTLEDDAWYTHHVVSLGYPKVKRDPEPYSGQMALTELDTTERDMTSYDPSRIRPYDPAGIEIEDWR